MPTTKYPERFSYDTIRCLEQAKKQKIPRAEFHKLLLKLREQVRANNGLPKWPDMGICYNATFIRDNARHAANLPMDKEASVYAAVEWYARNWPKHQGSSASNPVPVPLGYDFCFKLWGNHEYGKTRAELLDYLIRATR